MTAKTVHPALVVFLSWAGIGIVLSIALAAGAPFLHPIILAAPVLGCTLGTLGAYLQAKKEAAN